MIQKKKLQKPSELLNLYSQKLNQGLEKRLSPIVFELNFQYRSPHIAIISGYIVFRPGWILEFDEVMKQESNRVERLKYRYHVMDKQKQLILRYDNVPHFPKIKTHPHHKHIKDTVTSSQAPDLLEVIDEVEALIITEGT